MTGSAGPVAGSGPSAAVHRRVHHVMGMPISLALRGRRASGAAADAAWAAVVQTLGEVDRMFSTYRDDSAVSRLGRGELDPADCPPEVAQVLALGEQAKVDSGGAFDVWIPGPDGQLRLDPSGVVKGWAVDRAAASLRALEATDFVLSAGGDMACWVADDGSPDWRVGIEDPADPTRLLAVVPIRRGGVATSGTTHRGQHLVDARTGRPAAGLTSVTVVADDLTTADIDATAAFALGAGGLAWLTARGRSGLVVHADGRAEVYGG